MQTGALGLGLAAALSACAAPVSTFTVPEVISHIQELDGQVVTVDGWLATCAGYDCHIFGSLADMRAAESLKAGSDQWMQVFDRGISIGSGTTFDRQAAKLQHSHVRLKARVNKECWPARCTDRADVLQPISIERAE